MKSLCHNIHKHIYISLLRWTENIIVFSVAPAWHHLCTPLGGYYTYAKKVHNCAELGSSLKTYWSYKSFVFSIFILLLSTGACAAGKGDLERERGGRWLQGICRYGFASWRDSTGNNSQKAGNRPKLIGLYRQLVASCAPLPSLHPASSTPSPLLPSTLDSRLHKSKI